MNSISLHDHLESIYVTQKAWHVIFAFCRQGLFSIVSHEVFSILKLPLVLWWLINSFPQFWALLPMDKHTRPYDLWAILYNIKSEQKPDCMINQSPGLHTFCSPGPATVLRVPTFSFRSHEVHLASIFFRMIRGENHLEIKQSHKFVYKMREFKHLWFQILNNKH
jgi:hypothetical protein